MQRLELGGVTLAVREHGAGTPVLALHGFTGTGDTWAPCAARWPGTRVLAPDLPGHGETRVADSDLAPYTIEGTVCALVDLLDALRIPACPLLGYSLGGRIALRMALAHPRRVSSLILESASPGIEDPDERSERRSSDAALAERLERDGIEPFVDFWERLPLWESQAGLDPAVRAALRAERLAQSAGGLARSLRSAGAGEDAPVLDALAAYPGPLALIVGALDTKYMDLARRMAEAHPRAALHLVDGAGHAVHLEAPRAFAAIVREALGGGVP